MANTTFVNLNTIIVADWLNDVNNCVYSILGNGTTVPASVSALKTNLSLQNVDNTSDANKPLSSAATTALAAKVDKTSSTGSASLPVGTTAQRDGTPSVGHIRYNSTLAAFEGYSASGWGALGVGGSYAQAGDNTDITSLGNNTSTVYTTAGTSTAYTITPNPVITAYTAGQSFFVNFNAAPGASPTIQISGVTTPPNLVEQNQDGTFSNITANRFSANHRSRVTLLSSTQALVESLPTSTVLSATVNASGTSVDVSSGIPSWINQLDIPFSNLSTNGTSNIIVQLRSSSVVTSGYTSSNTSGSGGVTSNSITNGHSLAGNVGPSPTTFRGVLTLRRLSGNTWVGESKLTSVSSAGFYVGTSEIALAGDLDGFRLTTAGGVNTFSSGSFTFIGRK